MVMFSREPPPFRMLGLDSSTNDTSRALTTSVVNSIVCTFLGGIFPHEFLLFVAFTCFIFSFTDSLNCVSSDTNAVLLVGDNSTPEGRTILCLLFSSCLLCDHTPSPINETIAMDDKTMILLLKEGLKIPLLLFEGN